MQVMQVKWFILNNIIIIIIHIIQSTIIINTRIIIILPHPATLSTHHPSSYTLHHDSSKQILILHPQKTCVMLDQFPLFLEPL